MRTHGGKGSKQRKTQVTDEELALRQELLWGKPTVERREEIKRLLEEFKQKQLQQLTEKLDEL